MSLAASLSQLVLALTFAVAAVAKLADRSGTRAALEAFGVPSRFTAIAATSLPIVELLVAASLIVTPTAGWGAAAALLLLGIFNLAIGRTLRAGSAPDCNCFGGLAQTSVGRGTLLRNSLLGLVAAFIVLTGRSVSAFTWITVPAAQDRVGILLLMAGLAGLGWFCWRLLQQNGRLLHRLEAEGSTAARLADLPPLEVGMRAPGFDAPDLRGEPASLDSLLAPGKPVALVFTDPGCGACAAALETVARAQRERAGELTVAVISGGNVDRIEATATEFGLDRVIPQPDNALLDAYRVQGFPGVVEIDAAGAISRPAQLGAAAVADVVIAPPTGQLHECLGAAAR